MPVQSRFPLLKLAYLTVALAGSLSLFSPSAKAQTLVTYFNFEDKNLTSDTAVPPPLQSSTITTTFAAGDVTFPSNNGTDLNRAPGDLKPTDSPLRLDTNKGGENNSSIQFSVNATGLTNLSLSFATRTNGGFTSELVQYSVNGGAFVTLGTVTPTASYAVVNFDNIANTGGQANVTFKITFSGSGSGQNKSTDIDNIQVKTPEPTTTAAAGLAVLALCWHQRRRLGKAMQFVSRRHGLAT